MKKYRKCKQRQKRKVNPAKIKRRGLRSGSKEVKRILLEQNAVCDICGKKGGSKTLQLHHVFCIRHGFKTKLERCVLLCDRCHHAWHAKFDQVWDMLFKSNPQTDFMEEYNKTKGSLN